VVTPWDLEIDNGPWLNFMWSSLGREGPVGEGIRRSYDLLNTDVGRVLLAERVANAIVRHDKKKRRRARRWAVRALILRGLARLNDAELRHDDNPLAPAVDQGLGTYLEGPVAVHVWFEVTQRGLPQPKEVTFVFGHTHQPFTSRRPIGTLDTDLRLLNSGGWVVDAPSTRQKKGAGIVVLDDDLDAVLIRVFNHDATAGSMMLEVDHPDGLRVDSTLRDDVRKHLDARQDTWDQLCHALGAAVDRRRDEHRQRLEQEAAELDEDTRFGLATERILSQVQALRERVEPPVRNAIDRFSRSNG
jgi:hypothetical protein